MRQIEFVRRFSKKFEGVLESARAEQSRRMHAGDSRPLAQAMDRAFEAVRGAQDPGSLGSAEEIVAYSALEAIILERLRPAYLILCDEIEIHGDYDHQDLVEERKGALEAVSRGVGRVDLFHHSTLNYAGTGWLVEEDLVLTNRHVAGIFAEVDWSGGYQFRSGTFGEAMEARLDYVRQHEEGGLRRRSDVLEVVYIAGSREPDIALLRVERRNDLEPLVLITGTIDSGQPVAAVGYPAWDGGRNDPELMKELFQDIYDVKRFSPGLVTGHQGDGVIVLGDYTSLGGSSGSPILDLETGKAVGLHFAGAFRETNYAVSSRIVAAAVARVRTMVPVEATVEEEAPTSSAAAFGDRDGYDPEFLGTGDLRVPLPGLGNWADDVAPVSDDVSGQLKYRHFSVIQSASRRLPLLTAANIDGEKTFRLKREGSWRLDGRIALEHQFGNELYKKNPLDRGHMVRRRDPGWGDSRELASQGELDTFHYTNCVPQHEDLNQKDWVGLEDYILESAETRDFKVSVFTGPVLRDTDRRLRSQPGAPDAQIPEEFWKIAVMVHRDTGRLSATGYVLSHGKMIQSLTEAAFLLGKYETYQVQIARIEQETGLDFGGLKAHDPLNGQPPTEARFGVAVRRIEAPGDLRL